MLRVGLTGDLGSGKSTVAQMVAARGAIVFSSDEMARAMMQPGHAVYAQIVAAFGPAILNADQTLDRRELARLAFDPATPRIEELNAIIHPAVLNAQAEQLATLARANPHAIAVIESALIFTTKHAGNRGPWKDRFDTILLVTAPEDQKIARFIERMAASRILTLEEREALTADAHRRLAQQATTPEQRAECIILHNEGDLASLEVQVTEVWSKLLALEQNRS